MFSLQFKGLNDEGIPTFLNEKGQLLIEFDKDAIAAAGYDTVTPVVICNSDDFGTFETVTGKTVAEGDVVIKLAK